MTLTEWLDFSPCKDCKYREHFTSGVFCVKTQEFVPIGYHGCKVKHNLDEERRKEKKGITLIKLAHELRKLFNFRWLTLDENNGIDLWMCFADNDPPKFSGDYFLWSSESPNTRAICTIDFDTKIAAVNLNLSEYRNDNGDIDYSKCIVEVGK